MTANQHELDVGLCVWSGPGVPGAQFSMTPSRLTGQLQLNRGPRVSVCYDHRSTRESARAFRMELQYREMRLADIQSRLGVTDVAREIRSRALLAKLGVQLPPSPVDLLDGKLKAWECINGSRQHGLELVGHCTGDLTTGEILHLRVGADYEGRGIGRKLLSLTVASLRRGGAKRIWLAATPDPTARAYGFYRAVGWRPTGERTRAGEEILEFPSLD